MGLKGVQLPKGSAVTFAAPATASCMEITSVSFLHALTARDYGDGLQVMHIKGFCGHMGCSDCRAHLQTAQMNFHTRPTQTVQRIQAEDRHTQNPPMLSCRLCTTVMMFSACRQRLLLHTAYESHAMYRALTCKVPCWCHAVCPP